MTKGGWCSMWDSQGPAPPRSRCGAPRPGTISSRFYKSFFEMMPHLVERDHDLLGAGGRLGQIAGFVAIPVGITVADAEDAGVRAKTRVSHR
jgi:hypothetical protein